MVIELAKLVLELTDSDSAVEHRPMPVDDPTQRRPDITLARTRLGWSPTTPLRDGLPRVIEYFRGRLEL
jgi:UDP-glucuronate decarboxylase